MTVAATICEVPRRQPACETTQNEIKLHCGDCAHKVREEWEFPIDPTEFGRRLKYLGRCKCCGSKKMFMGWPDAAPETV
jgi:hypothetical protein